MRFPQEFPRELLAPCGLNCLLCHHHCKSAAPCGGCRGGRGKSQHCQSCDILACVSEKGYRYCCECGEFPCGKLTRFDEFYQNTYGHAFLPNAHLLLKRGEAALIEAHRRAWACPHCGGVVCIHDGLCSECGRPLEEKNL